MAGVDTHHICESLRRMTTSWTLFFFFFFFFCCPGTSHWSTVSFGLNGALTPLKVEWSLRFSGSYSLGVSWRPPCVSYFIVLWQFCYHVHVVMSHDQFDSCVCREVSWSIWFLYMMWGFVIDSILCFIDRLSNNGGNLFPIEPRYLICFVVRWASVIISS